MKKLNTITIDMMILVGVLAVLSLVFGLSGCAHNAPAIENCCQRLDVRTKEMQEFNRFCKVLVFAVHRTDKNTKTYESIQNKLGVCRFVFGVENDNELLSSGPDDAYYKVRQYIIPNPSENGWMMPLDCDPDQPSCEEF